MSTRESVYDLPSIERTISAYPLVLQGMRMNVRISNTRNYLSTLFGRHFPAFFVESDILIGALDLRKCVLLHFCRGWTTFEIAYTPDTSDDTGTLHSPRVATHKTTDILVAVALYFDIYHAPYGTTGTCGAQEY
jgi:hypothetical protein